jgi:hypothetical protein
VRKGGFHDENVSLPGALQSFAFGIEIIRSTRCEPVVSVFFFLKNWKIEMERIALYLEIIRLRAAEFGGRRQREVTAVLSAKVLKCQSKIAPEAIDAFLCENRELRGKSQSRSALVTIG